MWGTKDQRGREDTSCGNLVLTEGDIISVDGSSGCVYIGEIPTVLIENNEDLQRLLSWADKVARLKVRANAETVKDLQTAMNFGAQGGRTSPY